MQNKEILLENLNKVMKLFAAEKTIELRSAANDVMKKAAMQNDPTIANIAIVAYSLHKLMTKEHVISSGFWIEYKMRISDSLEKGVEALKRDNEKEFGKALNSLGVDLQKLDKELGRYIQGYYDKAKIKYAADAYYYGMSLSQAAALTGAGADSLQRYIGFTRQNEVFRDKKGIKGRLDELKQLIGKEGL